MFFNVKWCSSQNFRDLCPLEHLFWQPFLNALQFQTLTLFFSIFSFFFFHFCPLHLLLSIFRGPRVIRISGSLIWLKKPDGTDIQLLWWTSVGPVSQIHSPHLCTGAPGIFSDLLRSVQMLKREWGAETIGSYHTYSSLVKLRPWFLSLQWKTCLWAELQPWCLSL